MKVRSTSGKLAESRHREQSNAWVEFVVSYCMFLHLTKILFSMYYVPETVLGTRNRVVNKTKIPASHSPCSYNLFFPLTF